MIGLRAIPRRSRLSRQVVLSFLKPRMLPVFYTRKNFKPTQRFSYVEGEFSGTLGDHDDVIDIVDTATDHHWLGVALKPALDKRIELGRDLQEEEIPKATLECLSEAKHECFTAAFRLLSDDDKDDSPNISLLNEVLLALEDQPFCDSCSAFHEPDSHASCLGVYMGPGGFIGEYGDGVMPELDPSDQKYRGWKWDD
eukprot:scaffold6164_cov163-Amphora_coffeaeformis.AAC.10